MSLLSNVQLNAAWRRSLPGFALVLFAVLLVYRQTGMAMVEIWERSETFAHAFVVPPISVWLIWRQRAALARQQPSASPLFLLPMAAMSLLWLLGELAAVNAATQLAFTAMLVLSVPLCLGWSVARVIAFPLGFLFFAVPIGEFLMPQFMSWTADFTVSALRLSGIPVYREGLQFVIPSGNWSVVEACSGIRYLMASVMVGTLFAYLNYQSLKRRWIFVAFSVFLPIVANWIRAYLTVLLGHVSGNKLATGVDHLVYGWVFFGVIMLAMFMVGARWSEPDAQLSPTAPAPALARGGSTGWWPLILAFVLVCLPYAWFQRLEHSMASGAPELHKPVSTSSKWSVQATLNPRLQPVYEAPAAESQWVFRQGGQEVGVYAAYYRHQGYASKLISSNNELVTSKDRQWAAVGQASVRLSDPALDLRSTELRALSAEAVQANSRLLVWQIYWINGQALSSDWQAKVVGALYRLLGRGDDAAVMVFYTDKGEGGAGERLLQAFVKENWSALDATLRQTRDHSVVSPAVP